MTRALDSRRPIDDSEICYLEAVGGELRVLRAETGLTQADVAEAAHLSLTQYARIERAQRRTRRSTLAHIVAALFAGELVDQDTIVDQLCELAGPALAPEGKNPEKRFRRWENRRRRREAIQAEAARVARSRRY